MAKRPKRPKKRRRKLRKDRDRPIAKSNRLIFKSKRDIKEPVPRRHRKKDLSRIQDMRNRHKEPIWKRHHYMSAAGGVAEVTAYKTARKNVRIGFKKPKEAIVCERRVRRRQSLFALGKAGKGRKIARDRNYTEDSKVICKRR